MVNNSIVRARINEQIKEEAAVVLSEIGLSVSDALRMMLVRVAREKRLPFEPFIPNATTMKAIEAARRGEFITTCTLDNLFDELNAED